MSKWSKYNDQIVSYWNNTPENERSYNGCAKHILGVSEKTYEVDVFRTYIKRFIKRGAPTPSVSNNTLTETKDRTTKEFNKNGALFTYSGEISITSLEQALKFFDVDTEQYEVEKYLINSWDVTSKQGKRTNYQVKVWLKKRSAEELTVEDITNEYIEAVKDAINGWDLRTTPPKKSDSNNLFVPCIFDLHLGKLAWGEETGEDYDYKIAVKRFKTAIEDLIAKAEGYTVERVLFPVGNDIYNSDKAKPFPQTTNGTPQMDDLRWQKLFRTGVEIITWAVGRLCTIAPVDVVTVFSNHDHERVFYLGETLSAVFEGNQYVTVDNTPRVRKYYRWGQTLIGLAHGHNEKPQDLPLTMAQEAKDSWNKTFYREWLLGHLHHGKKLQTETAKDYRGVIVTYLTSPSASDAWHFERNFVGAIKGAEAYIYNKDEGKVGVVIHNIAK